MTRDCDWFVCVQWQEMVDFSGNLEFINEHEDKRRQVIREIQPIAFQPALGSADV